MCIICFDYSYKTAYTSKASKAYASKTKIFGLTNVHILITNLKKKCDEKDFFKMQIVRLIRIKFKKKRKNEEN